MQGEVVDMHVMVYSDASCTEWYMSSHVVTLSASAVCLKLSCFV